MDHILLVVFEEAEAVLYLIPSQLGEWKVSVNQVCCNPEREGRAQGPINEVETPQYYHSILIALFGESVKQPVDPDEFDVQSLQQDLLLLFPFQQGERWELLFLDAFDSHGEQYFWDEIHLNGNRQAVVKHKEWGDPVVGAGVTCFKVSSTFLRSSCHQTLIIITQINERNIHKKEWTLIEWGNAII